MSKQTINPPELFNSQEVGFSQVVVSAGSRMVHISGQAGWDEHRHIVGPGDLRAQTFQAFKNLNIAMQAAGGALADVVSLRIYIHQSVIHEASAVREGLLAFFVEHPPAATWIGVPALASPDFLIEIEAFAVLP